MRPIDKLLLALVAVVAISGRLFWGTGDAGAAGDRGPGPRMFAPGQAGDARLAGPRFVVRIDEKTRNSTGSAFSIDRAGVWVTARHVTHGCDRGVGILRGDGRLQRAQVMTRRHFADISILRTRGGAPALPLARSGAAEGADGYSFGFPKGRPGDVHGRALGRGSMESRGGYRSREGVVAWVHVRRIPDRGTDLGGISGGPWLNAAGEVVGVHVAGSKGSRRRGRSFSTSLGNLKLAIREAGFPPPAPADPPDTSDLSPERFGRFGDGLRGRESVAKVVCLVGGRRRTS